MNRKIIVALIIIVLIILVGLVVTSQNVKTDTQINFLSNATLKNGDAVEFQLVDSQGNGMEGQNLKIDFKTSEGVENYSVVTDSNGKGSLVLNDEPTGNYTITVSYAGDEKHNNCTSTEIITIGEGTSDATNANTGESSTSTSTASAAQSEQSSSSDSSYSTSSQSSSDLSYDSDLNVYYDSNGVIRGGQNDGQSYDYVKNNQPAVVDGSLE